MKTKKEKISTYKILSLTGILAIIFYLAHVLAGRMLWIGYNPISQPISDLTAKSAISQSLSSNILWGYDIFNIIFCIVLHAFFEKVYPINDLYFKGLDYKTLADVLSTLSFRLLPLAGLVLGSSAHNTLAFILNLVVTFSFIFGFAMMVRGLKKFNKHPKMARFLAIFWTVYTLSSIFSLISAKAFPNYLGLIDRINAYSLMVFKFGMVVWLEKLLKTPELLFAGK